MTKAKKKYTKDELKELITSNDDSSPWYEEPVSSELGSVKFDFENVDPIKDYNMPGTESMKVYEDLGGFFVKWYGAGGDWENPLAFCLYIGEDDKLHGYVPSDGNAYDHKNNCAWGSAPEEDDKYFFEHEDELYKFDAKKLRDDVKKALS